MGFPSFQHIWFSVNFEDGGADTFGFLASLLCYLLPQPWPVLAPAVLSFRGCRGGGWWPALFPWISTARRGRLLHPGIRVDKRSNRYRVLPTCHTLGKATLFWNFCWHFWVSRATLLGLPIKGRGCRPFPNQIKYHRPKVSVWQSTLKKGTVPSEL